MVSKCMIWRHKSMLVLYQFRFVLQFILFGVFSLISRGGGGDLTNGIVICLFPFGIDSNALWCRAVHLAVVVGVVVVDGNFSSDYWSQQLFTYIESMWGGLKKDKRKENGLLFVTGGLKVWTHQHRLRFAIEIQ